MPSIAPQVAEHIAEGKWKELDDVFWTVIPFGTGGRRGRMYPIGSNAINDRTIGESAQGLADYVKRAAGGSGLSAAIAYDTRHRSRHFAELCSEVMVAAGFTVYFLDGYRSTPELSFAVRLQAVLVRHHGHGQPQPAQRQRGEGLLVDRRATAAAARPGRDRLRDGVQDDRARAVCRGRGRRPVVLCQDEVDRGLSWRPSRSRASPGRATLKIIYSPLHGVGASAVLPALAADGFNDVEMFGPHAEPNGDFPNVPGHVANPENPAVFDIDHRAGQADRRRPGSGHAIPTATALDWRRR